MRGSGDMILTLALIAIVNKLCRSCSTEGTQFADVASRTVISNVVFDGRMLHPVEVSNPAKLSAFKFKVERILKGELPKDSDTVVVGTRVADGGQLDCSENLRPKKRYVVFLSSSTEMVGEEIGVYRMSGPPEEYSGKAAKDVEEHSCRNCVQRPNARLSPKKLSPAKLGSNVTIKCVVKGRPLPSVLWYKDDRPLNPKHSEHLVIKSQKSNSLLTIRSVSPEDEASYWCQAINVLATTNSTTLTLTVRRGGGGGGGGSGGQPEDVTGQHDLCPVQNRKYCLNGGECYLLPNNEKYCLCASGYTGKRCQDRGSELETSKIDVRASNTDKALVFVGLFLTLLVLAVLTAILYCVAKMRYEFSCQRKQMVNRTTATSPFRLEPPFLNQKVEHVFIQPTVHITEMEAAQSYANSFARRQRLSAVSSAVEVDPDFERDSPSHEESIRRSRRLPSGRVSTSSSHQGLLSAEDEVDGGAPGKSDPLPGRCPRPDRSAPLDARSLTSDSSRPLSSRSNYENERLCGRIDSSQCKMAGIATCDSLCKTDASNRETEEVNDLLKELGVYLPEDGSVC